MKKIFLSVGIICIQLHVLVAMEEIPQKKNIHKFQFKVPTLLFLPDMEYLNKIDLTQFKHPCTCSKTSPQKDELVFFQKFIQILIDHNKCIYFSVMCQQLINRLEQDNLSYKDVNEYYYYFITSPVVNNVTFQAFKEKRKPALIELLLYCKEEFFRDVCPIESWFRYFDTFENSLQGKKDADEDDKEVFTLIRAMRMDRVLRVVQKLPELEDYCFSRQSVMHKKQCKAVIKEDYTKKVSGYLYDFVSTLMTCLVQDADYLKDSFIVVDKETQEALTSFYHMLSINNIVVYKLYQDLIKQGECMIKTWQREEVAASFALVSHTDKKNLKAKKKKKKKKHKRGHKKQQVIIPEQYIPRTFIEKYITLPRYADRVIQQITDKHDDGYHSMNPLIDYLLKLYGQASEWNNRSTAEKIDIRHAMNGFIQEKEKEEKDSIIVSCTEGINAKGIKEIYHRACLYKKKNPEYATLIDELKKNRMKSTSLIKRIFTIQSEHFLLPPETVIQESTADITISDSQKNFIIQLFKQKKASNEYNKSYDA